MLSLLDVLAIFFTLLYGIWPQTVHRIDGAAEAYNPPVALFYCLAVIRDAFGNNLIDETKGFGILWRHKVIAL